MSTVIRIRAPTRTIIDDSLSPLYSFTLRQDEALRVAVEEHGTEDWKVIAEKIPEHSESQCLRRWQLAIKPPVAKLKGSWTKVEDEKIAELVKKYGPRKWTFIASGLPGRKAKQCRERWHNHLHPDISKAEWTEQEDRIILEMHQSMGNKWSLMTKKLPGRYVLW